jgi:isopenicillin N synthase-like dioxygenase
MSTEATKVPLVDFSALSDPSRHEQTVRTIGEALERFGFVALSGHGIDDELLADAYRVAGELFELDDEVKRAYETPHDGRQRGYTPHGTEHAKGQPHADLKEFWHVGRQVPADHPDALSGELPTNQWPAELPVMQPTFLELFRQMEHFGDQLLAVIAEHLGWPSDAFAPQTRDGNSVLRIIHYPPIVGAVDGQVRAAAHEDINLITVLPVSTAPGLELLTRDGQWIAVDPPAGTVICDTGDMMQVLTDGRLPATTHRVVNPPEPDASRARYSMPFFMHPRNEVVLRPARDGNEPITAGSFLRERLRETGMAGDDS